MRVNSVKKKGERRASSVCYLSVDHTACVLSLTHASCDWQVRSPHGEQGGERLRLREGGGRGRRERGRERRRRERERESGGNLKSLKPIWTERRCVSIRSLFHQLSSSAGAHAEECVKVVRKANEGWCRGAGSESKSLYLCYMYISKSFQFI